MDTPAQFLSRITANDRISEGFYELTLSWDVGAPVPAPGQFLTVRVGAGSVPLLRRPFAFAGFDAVGSIATVIYQKRGAGTALLAAARAGEEIDVIGPLGTPFVIDSGDHGVNDNIGVNENSVGINNNKAADDVDPLRKRVIVAGGIGIGPMLFLSSTLKALSVPAQFIFGCRNQSFIPSTKTFTDANPQICTDDGSAGFRGTVADYIDTNMLLDINTTVYACGPLPMLRSVNKIAQSRGARCLVSLEAVMACGVGACMGCAVPTVNGYSRVCVDGPVFNSNDIQWELMF